MTFFRPFPRLLALAAFVFVAGCDVRSPTAPPAPVLLPSAKAPDALLGSRSLTPQSDFGPVATLPANRWVIVRVSGAWQATGNPACGLLPPEWPCIFNPPFSGLGADYPDAFAGPVYLKTLHDGSWDPLEMRGTSATDGVGLTRREFDRELYAGPGPFNNPSRQQYGNTGPSISSWIITGNYTVTVTEVDSPIRLTESAAGADGSRTYTVEPLYGLKFINGYTYNAPPGAVEWEFIPGDSVSEEPADGANGEYVWECRYQTTCNYAPRGPGRMQVVASVETRRVRARSRPRVPPGLSCTSVPRGSNVVCTVTGEDVNVVRWRWVGGSDSVVSESHSRSWSGTAVVDGTVTAEIKIGGIEAEPLTTELHVLARPWRWNESVWTYTQGTALDCFKQRPIVGQEITWGWNVKKGSCEAGRILPDVGKDSTAGYSVEQPQSGPNAGLWYVSEVFFRMETESGVNPQLKANGTRYPLPNGAQAGLCRRKMGITGPPPVQVNFYLFNVVCKGENLDAFFAGIWSHEGYGTDGVNGHEAQGRIAAAKPENDPYLAVEPLWSSNLSELRIYVKNEVGSRDAEISNFSASHRVVHDNWCGRVWVFDSVFSSYDYVPVITEAGKCI